MEIKHLFRALPLIMLATQSLPLNAQQSDKQKTDNQSSVNIRNVTTDSFGETSILYIEDGHRHKIRMKNSKILEMYVDDKKVDEKDYSKYEPALKKILAQVEKDREQADKDREQAEKDRQQANRDRERTERDREQAESDREQSEKDRLEANKDREQSEKDRQQAEKDRAQAEKDRKHSEEDRAQALRDREQSEKDREHANKDRAQAEKDRAQAAIDRKQAEEDRKLIEAMMNEVVTDKIAENREAIKSLTLDDSELMVNGVKQSKELHDKFKVKYLKKKNGKISYKNDVGYKRVSFD